jgi:hypothetical protein
MDRENKLNVKLIRSAQAGEADVQNGVGDFAIQSGLLDRHERLDEAKGLIQDVQHECCQRQVGETALTELLQSSRNQRAKITRDSTSDDCTLDAQMYIVC